MRTFIVTIDTVVRTRIEVEVSQWGDAEEKALEGHNVPNMIRADVVDCEEVTSYRKVA